MTTFGDSGIGPAGRGTRGVRRRAGGLGAVARVVLIAIGTLIGEMLIPANAQAPGAMSAAAAVLAFAMFLIPAIEAALLGIKPALKISNLLLVGLIYWLLADLIQGLYRIDASNAAIEIAFLAIGLFAAGISVGGGIFLGGMPEGLRRLGRVELTDRQVLGLVTFCFCAGVFYFLFMARFSPSLIWEGLFERGRFAAPWARGALGNWHSFVEQLNYFGYLLPPLTAIIFMRSRSYTYVKVAYCALLSFGFLIFLAQGGGRTALGAILGSAILVGVLLSRRALKPAHIVSMMLAVFAVQVGMNVVLQYRNAGMAKLRLKDWAFSRVRVDDNFNRLAQTVYFVPTFYPYTGLQFVYFALIRPIPRALWPGKPIYQGFTVQQALGEDSTSLTNSVVGESYSGWGLPLVFAMGAFFGAAARWWQQTLEENPTSGGVLLYGLGTMALFCTLRGFVNIVLISYPIVSLWAVSILFRLTRSRFRARRGPR